MVRRKCWDGHTRSATILLVPPVLALATDLAVAIASASDDDVDQLLIGALATLAEHAQADRCYITVYHDDGTFGNSHEWVTEGTVPHLPAIQRMRSEDFAYSYSMVLRDEVFEAPDLDSLPPTAAAEQRSFSAFGVRAVLQVPIRVDGRALGLIGFNYHHDVDGWSGEFVDSVRRVGEVVGRVLVRHRAIEDARRSYESAARANRLKDELLAHVSHELRTPLHAILGYAELLELDLESERDRDALLQIQFNGRHLLTLVDDLLSIANSDASLAIDNALAPAVVHAIDSLRSAIDHHGIVITTTDRVTDGCAHTEPGRLRQVLYAVLSGAVHAVGAAGRVSIDAPRPSVLTLAITSLNPIGPEVVTPLAQALLDGSGTVSSSPSGERSAVIEVAFDECADVSR